MALPVGCPEPLSAGPRVLDVAEGTPQELSCFLHVCHRSLGWTTDPVFRGHNALGFRGRFLDRFVVRAPGRGSGEICPDR